MERFDLMYNDFVIVGPSSDPAKIENASSLKEIIRDREKFKKLYHVDEHGNYIHNEFKMELDERFSISERIKTLLS